MFVYIIQSGHNSKAPVKIGMSDDPNKRIKQLQTGNPLELKLLLSIKCKNRDHAFSLERTLHELLSANNIMNEWFRVCRSRIYKTINELANNPYISNVESDIGLFSKRTIEDKRKAKQESRGLSIEAIQTQNDNLVKKNNEHVRRNKDMEAKLATRRKEAGIFRSKLAELGFAGEYDILLGRK